MYEPKYPPRLTESFTALSNLRFGIIHKTEYLIPEAPETEPLHMHGQLEFFFNIASDVSFLVNNNLYLVPVGDAVLSRPGDIHMGMFHKTAVHEYICLWVDADFSSPLFAFLRKNDFHPLFSFDQPTKQRLHSLIFSLLDSCKNAGSELEKCSFLLQILSLFEQEKTKPVYRPYIPEALQRVLDDIHQNFSSIRTVNDILDAHFVSSSTLSRWFRQYLHSSPRAYLESVRLSNAAVLLENGYSVTEACMRSGFSDCSHFIVLFKKRFGKTPLQYKKK